MHQKLLKIQSKIKYLGQNRQLQIVCKWAVDLNHLIFYLVR